MLSNIHTAKHVVRLSHVRRLFLRQEAKVLHYLIMLQSVNIYGKTDIQLQAFLTTVLDGDIVSTSGIYRLTSTIIG